MKILIGVVILLLLVLIGETAYILYIGKEPNRVGIQKTSKAPHSIVSLKRHPITLYEEAYDEWDPFEEMRLMQAQMNRIFRNSFSRALLSQAFPVSKRSAFFEPDIDFEDSGKFYIARIDLPGMDKDKINIELKNNMLTISGERSIEREEARPADQFYSKERSFGYFSRTIPMPADAKSEGMTAEYDKGVLVIKIPKEDVGVSTQKASTKIRVD
ncbi:MAG: Hsp20/alpha crystallin family protein [Candidatus Omnitrophica bacterium]|nr:Hsp20/alpha crystallin family protein [Candidatus Omnitrophota bacterium]